MKWEKESRLTEGTNELPLYRPGDRLDEGGGREASKQHVVQEDDVEVPQPVVAAKVSQEIKAGDAWKHKTGNTSDSGLNCRFSCGSRCPPVAIRKNYKYNVYLG